MSQLIFGDPFHFLLVGFSIKLENKILCGLTLIELNAPERFTIRYRRRKKKRKKKLLSLIARPICWGWMSSIMLFIETGKDISQELFLIKNKNKIG